MTLPIEHNQLGSTAIQVPKICLGTMTWGEQNTQEQAHEQLDWALANGINFIDTAEMYPVPVAAATYTRTESIIGAWLHKQRRDSLILASKVAGPGRNSPWVREGARPGLKDLSAQDITLACEASLKRLGTDYLDLYQIHWPARNTPMFGQKVFSSALEQDATPLLEQIQAMDALVASGKIRAWGVSNETAWGVTSFQNLARQHGCKPLASVQNVFNLTSRDADRSLGEACFRENVGLLAYSPLAFGFLTGKYLRGAKPAGARITLFGNLWPRYANPRLLQAVERYEGIATSCGISLTQMALAFVYHNPLVCSTILGATTLSQLKECVTAYATRLDKDTLKAIQAVHDEFTNPTL